MRWKIAIAVVAIVTLVCAILVAGLLALHPGLMGAAFTTVLLTSVLAILAGAVLGWVLGRAVALPIERLRDAAAAIATGDLSHRVSVPDAGDEVGDLAASFLAMTEGLQQTLADLREAAGQLERGAQDILGSATRQAAMASQQAAAINETSTTASEIAQTSKQATEHADSVIQMTQRSDDLSHEGLQVVEESVKAAAALGDQVKRIAATMTDLSERTLQVGEIIASVKDLAEQSNLLALNASIEASKAGEHGRGFAVVAMEMRNLAEQSKAAAGQIRGILSEIQKGARDAAEATDEGAKRATAATGLARSAGEAIEGLAMVIRESALAARQIANNTRQQTIGVEQIVSAISELSQAINESANGTLSIEAGTATLSDISKRLSAAVQRYETSPQPRA
ncbi:MAG TPA: methyl-accepting chemotaxis protein [Anaeromyxobacteraceae bacterium]|nr:methyl-accepting chemotaxis protein [Anaeromyxobacteraceae bacterium]